MKYKMCEKVFFKGKAKKVFTLEAQQKRADNARRSNSLPEIPFTGIRK